RLGLPVEARLYDQRVFPACRVTLPPQGELRFRRPESRRRELREGSPEAPLDVEVPAHTELRVALWSPPERIGQDLEQVLSGPRPTGLELSITPRDCLARIAAKGGVEALSLGLVGRKPYDLRPLDELPRLRELRLKDRTQLVAEDLAELRLERLERLELRPWPKLPAETWRWLEGLPRLRALGGWDFTTPVELLRQRLPRIAGLQELDLSDVEGVNDAVIEALGDLSGLRELELDVTADVTLGALREAFAAWPRLERFSSSLTLDDATLGALPPGLRGLSAHFGLASDSGLESLSRLSLRELDLTFPNQLTARALGRALRAWPELRTLELFDVDAATRDALSELPASLRELNLSSVPADDLDVLAHLSQLESLTLWQLERLDLAGLDALTHLDRLYRLDLERRAPTPLFDLPSRGDTAFAGAVRLGENRWWLVNYSSPREGPDLPWLAGQVGRTHLYAGELVFGSSE
ncbi:MAG TPA: hypothetical protein DEA08_38450, partial [Planctomycetes bacterium]|nr:hypothetical protein [Planctomycetota bacterium]